MYNILLSLIFINIVNSLDCDCTSYVPIITNDFEVQLGSLCPQCQYIYSYPSGYDFVDIEFSYTDLIFVDIYQHGHIINSYNGTICFERLYIGHAESVIVMIYTLSNNIVWANIQHEMTFGNINTTENFCHAPQINTDTNPSQVFNSGCVYEYSFTFVSNLFVNIQFNDSVQAFIIYNNIVLYNETTDLLYRTFSFENQNIEYNYIQLHIWLFNSNVFTNKFIVLPTSTISYNIYYQNKYNQLLNQPEKINKTNNIKIISITALVFASIVITIMIIIGILVLKRNKLNNYQQL